MINTFFTPCQFHHNLLPCKWILFGFNRPDFASWYNKWYRAWRNCKKDILKEYADRKVEFNRTHDLIWIGHSATPIFHYSQMDFSPQKSTVIVLSSQSDLHW